MSSCMKSTSGRQKEYFADIESVIIFFISYWPRMSMPAPMPSEAVKARPSRICFRCFSKMMMTTRWNPPSRKRNNRNFKTLWQPKTPAYHNRKAASNNAHCLFFFRPVPSTSLTCITLSNCPYTSIGSSFAYLCVCVIHR